MIGLDQGGRGAPEARLLDVRPELAGAVEAVWALPAQCRPDAAEWRVVADPNPHVLLVRSADGGTRVSVVGARSRYVDVNQASRDFTLGIRLSVGTLPAVTGLPASDLLDRSASLAELFGTEGREVTRLAEDVPTPEAALGVVLGFLTGRLLHGQVDWRIRGFMSRLGQTRATPVAGLSRSLGVSPRTLRSAAHDHVGMSPKVVHRVHRLLAALVALKARKGLGGGRAALEAGFSDHAHLINECRRILGESPRDFLSRGDDADLFKAGRSQGR